MIITINSDSLTNVVTNNGIGDRTYYIEKFNELRQKKNVKIRYTFHAKTVEGEPYYPIYPIFDFGSNDNTRDQSLFRGGISSLATPHFSSRLVREVFSTSEDYDPNLVYYYSFSDGNNLLSPTPSPNLVPSDNASFQYVDGPFPGTSAINSTAGFFRPPMKLQVSNLDNNWGFSCWVKGNLTANSLFMQLRRQDARGFTNVNFQTPWPRIDVFFTPQGQLRIRCVDINETLVLGWTSNSQISAGNWGHMVISFSDAGQAVYINGILDVGVYTVGDASTTYDFSANLLPFELSEYRFMQTNNVQYALPTFYSDSLTAGEAADMYTNVFPYTTSNKVAFHYPLNNSLQPTAGYNLIDYTSGNLTYSSSVSKLNDSRGSALVFTGGISSLPDNRAPFMGLDDYSISFWFRTQTPGQNLFRLWGNRITIALLSTGALEFSIRTNNQHNIRLRSLINYANNEWHHVCFCISTTQGNRIYVNEILHNTVYNVGNQNVNFINTSLISSSTDEEISYLLGENPGANGTYFSDYALWNTFVSQETVSAIYGGTYNYQVSYNIPTGVVESYGGQISHRTPIYRTPIITPYSVDNNLRVRLGSDQPENVENIRNYLLTLYIED